MRFKGDVVLEYLRPSRVLRLSGKTTAGVNSKAELDVGNPRDFMFALGQCFAHEAEENSRDAIPIQNLRMGNIRDTATGKTVAAMFEFSVNGTRMRFLAPLEHLESDKFPAIEHHFQELTRLMDPGMPSVKRH